MGSVGCTASLELIRFPRTTASPLPLIPYTPPRSLPFSSLLTPSSRTALCSLASAPSVPNCSFRARDILALQTSWPASRSSFQRALWGTFHPLHVIFSFAIFAAFHVQCILLSEFGSFPLSEPLLLPPSSLFQVGSAGCVALLAVIHFPCCPGCASRLMSLPLQALFIFSLHLSASSFVPSTSCHMSATPLLPPATNVKCTVTAVVVLAVTGIVVDKERRCGSVVGWRAATYRIGGKSTAAETEKVAGEVLKPP